MEDATQTTERTDLTALDQELDVDAHDEVRHAFCLSCYPRVVAGNVYVAKCGVRHAPIRGNATGSTPPPDACPACIPPGWCPLGCGSWLE